MVNFHLSVSVLAGEGGFPLSVPLQSHNRAENSEFLGSKPRCGGAWSVSKMELTGSTAGASPAFVKCISLLHKAQLLLFHFTQSLCPHTRGSVRSALGDPLPPWEPLGMCCWRQGRNWVFTSGAGTCTRWVIYFSSWCSHGRFACKRQIFKCTGEIPAWSFKQGQRSEVFTSNSRM